MSERNRRGSGHGPRESRGVVLDRIVAAARRSFSENGWAGTSMRAVAHDAGVDPALVHYYFSGKDALLDACLQPPEGFLERIGAAQTTPMRARGAALVDLLLDTWEDPAAAQVLRSILLTAAHEPVARGRLESLIAQAMVGAVAERLDSDDRLYRACLVSSQLVGLAFLRYVWRVEPLASTARERVTAAIGPTIQRYLSGPLEVR
ncbi:TetR/AcrR family transcriptional regulator [Rhabdothermincola sp.]|uniref:TetR/AcrR family transcriptional regulator n=1 Tax=Rhabdothermincola sp. TaxID=2820405 RepID=UPI002FE3F9EF